MAKARARASAAQQEERAQSSGRASGRASGAGEGEGGSSGPGSEAGGGAGDAGGGMGLDDILGWQPKPLRAPSTRKSSAAPSRHSSGWASEAEAEEGGDEGSAAHPLAAAAAALMAGDVGKRLQKNSVLRANAEGQQRSIETLVGGHVRLTR